MAEDRLNYANRPQDRKLDLIYYCECWAESMSQPHKTQAFLHSNHCYSPEKGDYAALMGFTHSACLCQSEIIFKARLLSSASFSLSFWNVTDVKMRWIWCVWLGNRKFIENTESLDDLCGAKIRMFFFFKCLSAFCPCNESQTGLEQHEGQ